MESSNSQPAENIEREAGKRSAKRLKARHLSALTKKIIVEKFAAMQCARDVADSMDIPGLTGTTVSDVLHSFTIRKQPGTAQTMFREVATPFLVVRRTA